MSLDNITGLTKDTGSSAIDRVDDWFPTITGRTAWDDLFSGFFDDFDRYFGREQVVPCDVVQHKDQAGVIVETEIRYALAGYNKENVSVGIDGDKLYIKVEKVDRQEDNTKQYVHRGISQRRIEAAYSLNGYDKDSVSASFENGLLKVNLPVAKKSEAKKIEIK